MVEASFFASGDTIVDQKAAPFFDLNGLAPGEQHDLMLIYDEKPYHGTAELVNTRMRNVHSHRISLPP
ncbi:MAG: hypothetical protein WC132_04320 [Methanomethylophilus sp.]